jgi:hypothetical protein
MFSIIYDCFRKRKTQTQKGYTLVPTCEDVDLEDMFEDINGEKRRGKKSYKIL